MRIQEITEALARVPQKPRDNAHPTAQDPELAWLFDKDDTITVESVFKSILGNQVTSDDEDPRLFAADNGTGPGMVLLGPLWFSGSGGGAFSHMDLPPGQGGAVGMDAEYESGKAVDIAIAAHEAFHAKLQLEKKNFHNEHLVNRLAKRWLQDHLSGYFLHVALESILKSKLHYKGQKYDPSKQWIKVYNT